MQGKIERWYQTLQNRISPENHFLPGDLDQQIETLVGYYNHLRYHESRSNLTLATATSYGLNPSSNEKLPQVDDHRLFCPSA